MFLFVLSFEVLCSLQSSSLLPRCPNISQSGPQVCWGVLGVSLGGLQLTIWLCGQQCWAQTTQQAAAVIMANRPGRKQETGWRRQDILFIISVLSMTSRKHHFLMKNTWSEATCFVATNLSSNEFLPTLSQCVSFSVFMCICLLSLPFQPSHWHCFPDCSIIPDIKSYPLQWENKGGKEKHAFSFEYTPATTSQNSDKKRKKKTQKHKHSNAQIHRDKTQTWTCAHTHTHTLKHTSQTHSTYWQTNTQRNSKHKAQHSQKSTLCRNILKCVLQYN